MAEYIGREALIAEFKRLKLGENSFIERVFADGVYAIIEQFPAADVAPVVHGRWIGAPLCGSDNCKCSECGSWHNIHANLRGEIMQKYCQSCGAKMDGGDNNAAD